MDYNKEINFFRFLAGAFSVGLYDVSFLKPFYKKCSRGEVGRRLASLGAKVRSGRVPRGINLYIHIPFCAELCTFCHCAKTRLTSRRQLQSYMSGLGDQLGFFFSCLGGLPADSLYFGGGSPSLLTAEEIQELFGIVRKHVSFVDDIQINFEIHPAQLSVRKINALKASGVGRVSLGVQSFDPGVLKAIGRRQSLRQVEGSMKALRKVGIRSINIDLVAGLPAQTLGSFEKDVRRVVKMGADVIHLTPFSDIRSSACGRGMSEGVFVGMCRLRDRMIREAKAIVEQSGYRRYGFEAYAKNTDGLCRHEAYHLDRAASVVGAGPFANGILVDEMVYRTEPVGPGMRKMAYQGVRVDMRYSMARYLILNMLRGVEQEDFQNVFGAPVSRDFSEELAFLSSRGIISHNKGILKYRGDRSAGSLFEYFVLTKALYGPEVIRRLKELYRRQYLPSRRYTFEKDGFIRKMEDHWFLQIYYNVGL